MSADDIPHPPLQIRAWILADEFKDALIELETAQSIYQAGKRMTAAGEEVRPGSLERAERDLLIARARAQTVISALGRILDPLARDLQI